MIIGITGSYGAGKDTAAEILQKMNFFHVSFSDFLREELRKRDEKISRDALILLGNELRLNKGADILAQWALAKVKDGENYVFTSIRNPEEVKSLQQRKDFLLVEVIASAKVRLQRLIARNREEDPKTLEEMNAKEKLENTTNLYAQQLQKVAQMARVVLVNDSTVEKLQNKVERLVQERMFKLQLPRPTWDEYFMNIAEQVKKRSNCLSAPKGAIIVKEKQILSTGYCGTPKGIKNCREGGCKRCTQRHLGKIKSGDYYAVACTCAHAEENAIVQAACNGISTQGAILYTTFTPCHQCAKMIINAGIKEVIAKAIYPDDVGTALLKEAGVKLKKLV